MSKHTAVLFFILLSGLLFLALPGPARADGYADLLADGDEMYQGREEPARAKAALGIYLKAAALDPVRAEAHWRAAMTMYWLGCQARGDGRQQLACFKQGVEYARKGVSADPENPAPHYWLGICLGMYGDTVGKIESLNLVDDIKREMAEVIRIDPGFDEGGAYVVLGRTWFKVPGIFGGSNKKSIENLKTALTYGPDRPLTHLYLAEVYLDEGRRDLAETHLTRAIGIGCPPRIAPECKVWQKRAGRLMDKLKSKGE